MLSFHASSEHCISITCIGLILLLQIIALYSRGAILYNLHNCYDLFLYRFVSYLRFSNEQIMIDFGYVFGCLFYLFWRSYKSSINKSINTLLFVRCCFSSQQNGYGKKMGLARRFDRSCMHSNPHFLSW